MEPDPDFRHLLDGPSAAAPADDLQAIVRRAGRRTARWGAAAGVVVLGVGGLGGYLLADPGASSSSVVATASPQVGAPQTQGAIPNPAASGGVASGGVALAPLTIGGSMAHDFTRTSRAGVTLRDFRVSAGASTQQRLVEVSTSGMVGTLATSQGMGNVQADSEVLGNAEGAPVIVVTAWTSATVTEVRWSGEGAGDAMVPVGHFVALAVPVSSAPADAAAIGTLTFTDRAGHEIDRQSLHLGGFTLPTCAVGEPPVTSMGTAVNPRDARPQGVGASKSPGTAGSSPSTAGSAGSGSVTTACPPSVTPIRGNCTSTGVAVACPVSIPDVPVHSTPAPIVTPGPIPATPAVAPAVAPAATSGAPGTQPAAAVTPTAPGTQPAAG